MVPEIGQRRSLKNSDGSVDHIVIASVVASLAGENAYNVTDTNGKHYVFCHPGEAASVSMAA